MWVDDWTAKATYTAIHKLEERFMVFCLLPTGGGGANDPLWYIGNLAASSPGLIALMQ